MLPRILSWILGAFIILALPVGIEAGQAQPAASPFKGEYFVTRNQDPICVPYAKNLNQFRRMDFDACDPRLSEKYPQFTRPVWEEIPLDLALAETIIMNLARRPTGKGDPFWEEWLRASALLRAEGKLKLWRTRIDIDGDGKPETILRLDNPLSTKYWQGQFSWTVEPNACPYLRSTLYMLESPNDSMKNDFNHSAFALGGDIIHFPFPEGRTEPAGRNGYYAIALRTSATETDGVRIGATRGMQVYVLFHFGAGDVCWINWVPTGHYRPSRGGQSPR